MLRLKDFLRPELEELKAKHLYRSPELFSSRKNAQTLDRFADFSSNDYREHARMARKPETKRGVVAG